LDYFLEHSVYLPAWTIDYSPPSTVYLFYPAVWIANPVSHHYAIDNALPRCYGLCAISLAPYVNFTADTLRHAYSQRMSVHNGRGLWSTLGDVEPATVKNTRHRSFSDSLLLNGYVNGITGNGWEIKQRTGCHTTSWLSLQVATVMLARSQDTRSGSRSRPKSDGKLSRHAWLKCRTLSLTQQGPSFQHHDQGRPMINAFRIISL